MNYSSILHFHGHERAQRHKSEAGSMRCVYGRVHRTQPRTVLYLRTTASSGSASRVPCHEEEDFFLLPLTPAFSFPAFSLVAPSFHNIKITCPGEQEGMS